MKFKKLLSIALTALISVSVIGCGSGQKTEEKKGASDDKTITVWAWDDAFNVKAANMAKERYLKNHPDVKIDVVSMAREDVVQKLNTGLSAGTHDALPNIVLVEDYSIQNYLKSYPGEIKDLTGYVNPKDFMDYKLGVMTEGDKIFGVPFDTGVAGLFYRLDYIEQAGYTEADMQDLTWDKYIEIGKKLKETTGKNITAVGPTDLSLIRMMMQSAGKWYVDENGKVDIAGNQALKDALEVYKRLIDEDVVKQIANTEGSNNAFQSGETASVIGGCWLSSTVKVAEDQAGKWRIASMPRMEKNPNSVNASNLGGSSWYVLDKVGNSDLAADFLKETFASDVELMNELVPAINLVSTLKPASESANYDTKDDFYGGQQVFKDFAKWGQNIPNVNYGFNTYELESVLAEGFQEIMAGGDVDEVLKNVQAQAESSINQ